MAKIQFRDKKMIPSSGLCKLKKKEKKNTEKPPPQKNQTQTPNTQCPEAADPNTHKQVCEEVRVRAGSHLQVKHAAHRNRNQVLGQ